jgi:hypothetical protein
MMDSVHGSQLLSGEVDLARQLISVNRSVWVAGQGPHQATAVQKRCQSCGFSATTFSHTSMTSAADEGPQRAASPTDQVPEFGVIRKRDESRLAASEKRSREHFIMPDLSRLCCPWRMPNLPSFPSTRPGRIVAILRFSDLQTRQPNSNRVIHGCWPAPSPTPASYITRTAGLSTLARRTGTLWPNSISSAA